MMLIAVHLDAVLTPPAILIGFLLLLPILVWSMANVADDELGRLGVTTAAFFVASQVHLPIGVVSVHLLLNAVAGIMLGRRAPIALTVGLVLQALLFAHGSLPSLGINAVVYSLPALIARPLLDWMRRLLPMVRGAIVGGMVALLTVSLSALALGIGGEPALRAAAPWAFVFNLPVVIVEAIITGFLLSYLAQVRPEWLSPNQPPVAGSG